jgi:alpha-L-rhamnosidase
MNQNHSFIFRSLWIGVIFFSLTCTSWSKTLVSNLTCEYRNNPIGIDVSDPRLSWQISSEETNVLQTAYQLRAALTVSDLASKNKLVWNSGKIISDQSTLVSFHGTPLSSGQRIYWQVRVWDNHHNVSSWSEPSFWEMGLLHPADWIAKWISSPWKIDSLHSQPCPYFRKEFISQKQIASARIYVTSLGLYELFLNGQKVGNQLFTPGWTSYNKRLQYQVYDVTSLIKKENAIGAILGDGWYRGGLTWDQRRNVYGKELALLLQLQIKYADGTSQTITSDGSWKVSTGAIISSEIYNGEIYDSRLDMPGWSQPNFVDNSWQPVTLLNHSYTDLVASDGVPVEAIQTITPKRILITPKGETVFDLGQNMTGWVRLRIKGYTGDTIQLKFAEVLDKTGNFYTANLRSAKATDCFILKNNQEEIFEPHFTYHGFRYVEIEGLKGTPTIDQITGVVIHSNMQPTGYFSCSDSLINQLQHNIQWGQKGNFLDVPTDCPQRDERLGWTGDAEVFSPTAAFNFNVAPFYTKWLKDLAVDQLSNGLVPHVIPDVLNEQGGATGWADVSVIIPWNVYLSYGDIRILKVQYSSMRAWVDYINTRAGNKHLWEGDPQFGDWLAFATNQSDYPGATTDKNLIATAYFAHSSMLLSQAASVLGKEDDALKYKKLFDEIKEAFNREYVTQEGRIMSNTQTAYVLALAFHLLPDSLNESAANYLAEDVRNFGHLTTGFLGTPLLCEMLTKTGHADLAYMLINRKEYPSWLYPVTQGATTIWERWDGQKPDGSFQDVGMNSFNHYSYGAVGDWLYRYVAGLNLDPSQPGYHHIFFNPLPGGGLTCAIAKLMTMYGQVTSDWKIENGNIIYHIVIPANATGTAWLPGALKDQVKLIPFGSKIPALVQQTGCVKVELGSGTYTFKYPFNNTNK